MIAGIDPSLSCTGVVIGNVAGVFDENEEVVMPEAVKKKGKVPKSIVDRFGMMEDLVAQVSEILSVHNIEAIYLEHYFAAMRHGVQSLYEFGSLLRWELIQIAPVIEVTTTQLKKFATGKGNSPKSVCAAHIAKRYGVEFYSDDLYDAYGLYQLGCVHSGGVEATNQAQRDVMESIG